MTQHKAVATSGVRLTGNGDQEESCYAPTRTAPALSDCAFYHTMEIPGHGLVKGQWDLRGRERKYLGGVDLRGRRVLEVGTASGHLCFYMEDQGADIVAYDLSDEHDWDVVPFATDDHAQTREVRRSHISTINNGWWLNHAARKSTSRMVYGTVYDIPEAIGSVDIVTFGAILLHLRDPFLALQRATALKPGVVVVTESISVRYSLTQMLAGKVRPGPIFLPDARLGGPKETWWLLTPDVIKQMLGVLGYSRCEVSYHVQRFEQRPHPMFTVLAHRT